MANSGIVIRDVEMLDGLRSEFEQAGSQMAHIDADVRVHLDSVRNDLQRQLEVIQGKLRNAEHRLSAAQSALNACQVAAAVAAAMGVCQTCVLEEQEVSMANMEVAKWQTRYSQGQQILSQCQQDISNYESGAHQLVERMCNEQTPQATNQLNRCIEMLQDILRSEMGMTHTEKNATTHTTERKASSKPTTDDSRFDDFRKNIKDGSTSMDRTPTVSRSPIRPTRFK